MTNTEPHARRASPGGETTAHHDQSRSTDAAKRPTAGTEARVEPQMPHERDESASSQASASATHAPLGKQALEDTLGPGVDTDRGPLLDGLYNESVTHRDPDEPPRR